MSEKVREAIAATRAGQKREAQLLLAEALQENPNDGNAWFLLGNLVDSPEKRLAYFGKALAINPDNAKAKRQLVQAQRQITAMSGAQAEPVVVMVEEEKVTAVADDLSELPDWFADQVDDDLTEEAVEDGPLEKTDVIGEEEVAEPKQEMVAAKTAVSTPAKPTTTKTNREQQLRSYNQILAFLVILIIIVLIALIWSL
jgi:tetratricopeptide (TPR) repeat protein